MVIYLGVVVVYVNILAFFLTLFSAKHSGVFMFQGLCLPQINKYMQTATVIELLPICNLPSKVI